MKNGDLHIEELIAKYLGGECSAAEEAELLEWTKQDIANRQYFDSLKSIYDKSASLKSMQAVDTDAAWKRLKASIDRKEQTGGKIRSIRPNYFMRIAALLLLVGGLIAVIYNLNSGDKPVLFVSGNEEKEVLLPDSTKVFLNKNSSIEYAYNNKGRNVTLKGEAYFEVVHESRPFIVMAGNLEIKDIGTAFNIDATSPDVVDVFVESGEVALKTSTESLNLVKGERSVYKEETKKLTKLSIADPNTLSYKTKIFVFENTSLPAVIEKLNEVYGTNIMLSDNLKYCRLTSTFKNEKIESILQIIAETLQLRIVTRNSQTILEGNSCEE